jgi:PIN domain nuclease of toxin-antitoxin system
VNLLLDSHTLLWLMQSNPNLSSPAAKLIADPANRLYLSMASIWEIGIKSGLGKMGLSVPYATFLDAAINGYGLIVLPITTDDCVRYESLAFPDPQHRDPFDRMIITHAIRDVLAIVSADTALDCYGVTRLW